MSDIVCVIILSLSGSFVTTLSCVLGLWLGIWIFYKQPVRGGLPVWKLAGGLVASHSKNPVCYVLLPRSAVREEGIIKGGDHL